MPPIAPGPQVILLPSSERPTNVIFHLDRTQSNWQDEQEITPPTLPTEPTHAHRPVPQSQLAAGPI